MYSLISYFTLVTLNGRGCEGGLNMFAICIWRKSGLVVLFSKEIL